jgi:hypothetical protein
MLNKCVLFVYKLLINLCLSNYLYTTSKLVFVLMGISNRFEQFNELYVQRLVLIKISLSSSVKFCLSTVSTPPTNTATL